MKPDCPCMDCKRRELGCHGKCQSYMDWKQKEKDRKDAITADREKDKEYMLHIEESKLRLYKARKSAYKGRKK